MSFYRYNPIERIKPLYFFSFITAVILYGVMGSPTPDNPGWAEGIIFTLLMIAFMPIAAHLFTDPVVIFHRQILFTIMAVLALYGLTVSLSVSVFFNHSVAAIGRDVIGFLFLLLPIPIYYLCGFNQRNKKIFLIACIILSTFFAARVVFDQFPLWRQDKVELLYLANSPLVIFSLLYVPMTILHYNFRRSILSSGAYLFVIMSITAVIFFALIQDVQRAPIMALALGLVVVLTVGMYQRPMQYFWIILGLSAAFMMTFPWWSDIVTILQDKTIKVGSNMRIQELDAIFDTLSASPWTLLFGMGWGSSFASPAVGDLYVTYSHSLLTYIFFKMGIMGLFLLAIMLILTINKIFQIAQWDIILANALFWALVIPVFLYASHKSFDFGLLLGLIFVSCHREHHDKAPNQKTIHSIPQSGIPS